MRKPRAFRPTADPLETRMVPSSVTVAMRGAAQLANFHPALQFSTPSLRFAPGTVGAGQLTASRVATGVSGFGSNSLLTGRNGPIGNGPVTGLINSITTRTSTGVTTFNTATQGVTPGFTSTDAGRRGPIGNGPVTALINSTTTRTSTGVTTFNNVNGGGTTGTFGSAPGVITGLTFNTPPGAITGMTLNTPTGSVVL
jgi:hypothetical protein